jgi:hypothetical protein
MGYNPELGVFMERDKAEASKNLYDYVGGLPTSMVDPLGLWRVKPESAWGYDDDGNPRGYAVCSGGDNETYGSLAASITGQEEDAKFLTIDGKPADPHGKPKGDTVVVMDGLLDEFERRVRENIVRAATNGGFHATYGSSGRDGDEFWQKPTTSEIFMFFGGERSTSQPTTRVSGQVHAAPATMCDCFGAANLVMIYGLTKTVGNKIDVLLKGPKIWESDTWKDGVPAEPLSKLKYKEGDQVVIQNRTDYGGKDYASEHTIYVGEGYYWGFPTADGKVNTYSEWVGVLVSDFNRYAPVSDRMSYDGKGSWPDVKQLGWARVIKFDYPVIAQALMESEWPVSGSGK